MVTKSSFRRSPGKHIAERIPEFVKVRDRMREAALRGWVSAAAVGEVTEFIEALERYAVRLKVWQLGGFKGRSPVAPEVPDFAAMISACSCCPESVLHVH